MPADVEIEMQGESLFNDQIGIVLFPVLLRFALGSDDTGLTVIFGLLLAEAGGGIALV